MGKKKFNASNKDISDLLYLDYVKDQEFIERNDYEDKLKLLVYNDLAWKTSGKDSVCSMYSNTYRVACKFIQIYNKVNKKYRRPLKPFELGSKDSIVMNTNDKLMELTKYVLDEGVYYCRMDKNNYARLSIEYDSVDDYDVKYVFYVIGKDWQKWKNEFLAMVKEYADIAEKSEEQFICYTDGRARTNAIFKPFNQVIMKDKDKLIAYIDNWVSNIPIYYDKYKMISKLSIMLYGNPGTGKSTVARAIAEHLGINTVTSISADYFSYNSERSGGRNTRRSSSQETVYTIDDIDCICKSREESDDKENSEILSSLLAFLDNPPTFFYHAKNGIDYPISIVVATTNYYDKLDSAVKRYGRFDLKIEMNDFDKIQAEEMCGIYELKLSDVVDNYNDDNFKISPAYLQALCLENIDKSLKKID